MNKEKMQQEKIEYGIKVQITEFVDAYQPGIVRCKFVDANGKTWSFVEKLPYITASELDETSAYPQPGTIDCVIVEKRIDKLGREIISVDTEARFGIEAEGGGHRFEILADQLAQL